jgi:hypothetical protein
VETAAVKERALDGDASTMMTVYPPAAPAAHPLQRAGSVFRFPGADFQVLGQAQVSTLEYPEPETAKISMIPSAERSESLRSNLK